jgi:hypothetical protein
MGKKKRTQQRTKPRAPAVAVVVDTSAAPVAAAKRGAVPPPRDPAFWFGFEVSWAKLVTARVVLFGLLALDAILAVRRAPRYGANDFNVANLGFLDHLGPGRVAYGVCQLAIALLLTAVALGVATRIALPIAAALYAWLYFGSQLDSYQHHYLVALVLALACFVPWQRPADPAIPVRTWAVRLLLVQLGIMYLWAAISKLDPLWLDGTTLSSQLTGSVRSLTESTVGFRAMSWLVVAVELALAFTVWLRPAWKFAAPLGLAFHLGIVATGFEIGLFAYVMCALYILVVPDRVWTALGSLGFFARIGRLARATMQSPGKPAVVLAALFAIPIALLCRLPHAVPLVAIALGLAIVAVIYRQLTKRPFTAALPIAVLAGALLLTVVDRATTVAIDYYRFWGGSQRRVGDRAQAEAAYRGMLGIEPHSEIAHFYLGRILIQTGRAAEGLAHLHEAQLEPHRARAHVQEARYLMGQGKQAEAIAKAKDAVFADPSDGEARAVLDMLQGQGSGKPAKPSTTTDDDL